jgi:hypothetical protein
MFTFASGGSEDGRHDGVPKPVLQTYFCSFFKSHTNIYIYNGTYFFNYKLNGDVILERNSFMKNNCLKKNLFASISMLIFHFEEFSKPPDAILHY